MPVRRSHARNRLPRLRAGIVAAAAVGVALGWPSLAGAAPSPATTQAATPGTTATPGTAATPAAAPAGSSARSDRRVVQARPKLPSGTRAVGKLAAGRRLSGAVALKPRDPAALTAYATDVSTPGNPLFHHYLAKGAFDERFGPSAATVAAVTAKLEASGLTVSPASSDGLLLRFTGTAADTNAAFGTTLESYKLRSGRQVTATTSAASLPSGVAPYVQGVMGLDNVIQAQPEGLAGTVHRGGRGHTKAAAPAAASQATTTGPTACPAATNAANLYGGLTDTQLASAYGLNGLYQAGDAGAGQTVAVFELEPYERSDISAFDRCYFGAGQATSMLSRLKTIPVDGGEQTGYGYGEAELDIQNISALAPGADINVYEAPNTEYGALDEYARIVNDDSAKVISTSWGFCELALQQVNPGVQQLENTLFEQAAAQGQTVFAAAGDAGSDDCSETGPAAVPPLLSVDDPGSQPFVVSTGGTTTLAATQPPQEKIWNDGADGGGGGGGISGTWAEPAWQATATVPGITSAKIVGEAEARAGNDFCLSGSGGASACREVPDVSANADEYTGAITVYYEGQWGTVGGTSAAAPIWAAVLADINASAACTGTAGVGFANPLLYEVADNPAEYAASFTDVTQGNNDAIGVDRGLFPATNGYDMASGLGTPQVTGPSGAHGLAYYLCTAAKGDSSDGGPLAVTGLTPSTVSGSGGSQVIVTGSGFESASGAPDVADVHIGTYPVPSAYYRVTGPDTLSLTVPSSAVLAGAAGNSPVDGTGVYDVVVAVTGGRTSAPGAASRLVVTAAGSGPGIPAVDGVGPSGGNDVGGNTVTVYGSGFVSGSTSVSFGGVPGTAVNVVNPAQLTVVVPAYGQGTTCATATDPSTDVCQAEVQVTTPGGTSATSTVKPPMTGAYAFGPLGIPTLPANCGCELAPAPTEYDYLPTPTITAVHSRPVGADGRHYASENGTTVETIDGKGLGILGLEWVDVGPSSQYNSEDYSFNYVSGTELQVVLPGLAPTTGVVDEPLSVQTLASPNQGQLDATSPTPSNQVQVSYAPPPVVDAVSSNRWHAGPTSGGTALTVTGTGLAAANRVVFWDQARGQLTRTTAIHVAGNDTITLKTPAAPSGVDEVQVCDATSCSARTPRQAFTYFPPGDPHVTSISRRSGPAAGGQTVTVTGRNLGFLKTVYFGLRSTTRFTSVGTPSDVGSTTRFSVVVPAGTAGQTVNVRVVTLESEVDKTYPKSPVNPSVSYRYNP